MSHYSRPTILLTVFSARYNVLSRFVLKKVNLIPRPESFLNLVLGWDSDW